MTEPECPNGCIECIEHFKLRESLELGRSGTSFIHLNLL
jgi:hypothetical protein